MLKTMVKLIISDTDIGLGGGYLNKTNLPGTLSGGTRKPMVEIITSVTDIGLGGLLKHN